ncbi:MAG: hypothetical protein IKG87_08000, partial [Clostridia bacterium]|nr:hypothetical protein [Clostridia bacterium]
CELGNRMCRIRAPSFLPAERRRALCPPTHRGAASSAASRVLRKAGDGSFRFTAGLILLF